MKQIILLMVLLFNPYNNFCAAEKVELILPRMPKNPTQSFFVTLLNTSLKLSGHGHIMAKLSKITMTQKRGLFAFKNNQGINLLTMIHTKERDKKHTGISVDLTENLFGHRVLLIPKKTSKLYSQINSLDDFKNLKAIGIFGAGWFDAKVWKANQLPYIEIDGDWRTSIFPMLNSQNRGVDYFSRSVTEILYEAKNHPYLDIEPRLILLYNRDIRFYLNEDSAKYKNIIESSLLNAKASGLLKRLIKEEWSIEFKNLNLENRVRIKLNLKKL